MKTSSDDGVGVAWQGPFFSRNNTSLEFWVANDAPDVADVFALFRERTNLDEHQKGENREIISK